MSFKTTLVTLLTTAFVIAVSNSCVHQHLGSKGDRLTELRETVTRCWTEKLKGNWAEFERCGCQSWRSKIGPQGLKPKMRITSFQVGDIEMVSEGEALVTVSFDFETMGYSFKGASVKERWVLEGRRWSFCPNMPQLTTPFGPLKTGREGEP